MITFFAYDLCYVARNLATNHTTDMGPSGTTRDIFVIFENLMAASVWKF